MSTEKNTTLQSTFKSQDTEEWLDIHFTRPLGLLWARFFNHFDVHPNVVTILSIFLGAGTGVCFFSSDLRINILGIFLLIWANIYDSCDGQMARMTGKKTRWGRILDGFAGDVWFVMIYLAIVYRLFPVWGWWGLALCAVAGIICHAKQSQLADYYRNIHLYFLKGESGSELDNSQKLEEEFKQLKWSETFFWKLFLHSYASYTRSQENMSPAFQRFKRYLKEKYDNVLPQSLRDEFCAGSRPLMPFTNILTFNARAITLYVSLLVGEVWIYPVVEITLFSALFFYMRSRHESLCRRLQAKY